MSLQLPRWLVGCFGLNGPLRQYFSLYRAVSQREGERKEVIDERKMSKQPPPAPTASAVGPCPTGLQTVGRPGTGSSPSTIAPPDHPTTTTKANFFFRAVTDCPLFAIMIRKTARESIYLRNMGSILDIPFQGGESRKLFYTCIRPERVRKLFITFLILNELSCG